MPTFSIFIVPLQKYLHESRHRHAMNRVRGDGGRFFSKEELELRKKQAALASGDAQSPLENGLGQVNVFG